MGLFGALFAGVSGLSSQSNKIGVISNNISNVNTVGFKQGSAAFDTLVVPSGTTSFSPGGVISNTQQLVDQQGLIQATSSPTDVAITGGGFFMVNTKADGTGDSLLTRAGSFTQDALGNFKNANGFFLQGIRVATGQPNFSTLQTVNVNSSATGAATPTSLVTLAANFNAAQSVLLGSGEIATLANDPVNSQNTASQIIIPTAGNALHKGDSFSITSVNAADTFTLTYDGFAKGRDITATINTGAATTGVGDAGTLLDKESLAGSAISSDGADNVITVTVNNIADYTSGTGHISISGSSALDNIPASEINGEHVVGTVTPTGGGAGTVTFTVVTSDTGAGTTSSTAITASNRTYALFTGNIFNATVAGADLLSGITDPGAVFTSDALQFKIATGADTFTFKYNAAADTTQGQFNSLNTLATAINSSSNSELTASVVGGRLYVSASDANNGVGITNGDAAGNGSLAGIDWTQELDLPAAAVAAIPPSSTTFRYNTLGGLANTINANDPGHNLVASLSSLTGISPTVSINETDPQSQVTFSDAFITNPGGSLIQSLDFKGPNGANLSALSGNLLTTLPLDKTYSAASKTTDMSSGAVTPQFTKALTIFDSLGNSHNVNLNVAKIGVNQWAVELTVVPASDLATVSGGTNDGQIGSGIVTFSTDGVFQSVKSQTGVLADSLAGGPPPGTPITINWSQSGPNAIGASPSKINVDLTGLIQSAAAFNVSIASQNGSSVGELTGVSIDQSGFIIESFSNGQTQRAFQIPLASVSNPDGLEGVSGNAYKGTLASGTINPVVAGTNGTGTITPSALEQSNVDLSTQLTNLIVAQQAYGANSKVLTIADQLLQQLDQIIQ